MLGRASRQLASTTHLLYLSPSHLQRCATSLSASARRYSSKTDDGIGRAAQGAVRIFSGIQPTGAPHLGNYLGAILPWVQLQNSSAPGTKLIFSIVDLHSLTSNYSAANRLQSRRQLLASFIAAGLDPTRCTIFYQSAVPEHAELHWILSCTASMSTLARMTQWKTKLEEGEHDLSSNMDEMKEVFSQTPNPSNVERLKLGLFSYPVLQAADILVHRATHVPVGEDQRQHIEFARTCAATFNYTYGGVREGFPGVEILPEPEVMISKAKRVMSLTEPERKMSKSHASERSRILLTDSDEQITKKFKTALTDSIDGISYDRTRRSGVSNLLEIIANLEHRALDEVVQDFKGSHLKDLKMRAAQLTKQAFRPMREQYQALIGESNGTALDDIAAEGAEEARKSAQETMKIVRLAIGI